MHLDPLLPVITKIALIILGVGLLMRRMKQPFVVGYLLAGVLLGPYVLGIVTNIEAVSHLGALGVVLLLFFVGMEMSVRSLGQSWKVAFWGTFGQVLASVAAMLVIGFIYDWPLPRVILIGFVISLSSTAVVIRFLQEQEELDTPVGHDAVAILLAQDLLIIPMLIVLGVLGSGGIAGTTMMKQATGSAVLIGLVAWALRRADFRIPFISSLKNDHESQVYAAAILCLGLAYITGLLELSTALGAFCAGLLVSAAKESDWVHQALRPFYIVFVATFFMSVGLLLDLDFLTKHFSEVVFLIFLVLLFNTAINASILRLSGREWRESLYGGALLAQVGEFSFVLAAVGFEAKIISEFGYQLTMSVIALSLLVSPAWASGMRRLVGLRVTELDRAPHPARTGPKASCGEHDPGE